MVRTPVERWSTADGGVCEPTVLQIGVFVGTIGALK